MKVPALIRKSVADVTRRRGRTILVILGILIGVFGLTTINVTSDGIQSAFAYITTRTASPNISFLVQNAPPRWPSVCNQFPTWRQLRLIRAILHAGTSQRPPVMST